MNNIVKFSEKALSEPLHKAGVIGSCDTLVFKWIEKKHDEFYENELKMDLWYVVALNKNDDQLGEVFGHCSYCEDCKDEAKKEFNKILKKNREKLDINCDDSDYKNVKKIVMRCESSPERDDFLICDNCGSLILVGVLHTYSQEIEHYLSDGKNLHIKHLSNDDCYRIHELIQDADYPELIKKLKQKIIKQND